MKGRAPLEARDRPSTEIRVSADGWLRSHGDAVDLTSGTRPPKTYRGSRRRIRQLKMRDHWSLGLWLLVAWVVFLILVVLPWMIRHSE